MSEPRAERRGRGGRYSQGDRVPCTIRFPRSLHEVVMRGVEDADYATMQDFVVDVMTAAYEAGLFPAQARPARLPLGACRPTRCDPPREVSRHHRARAAHHKAQQTAARHRPRQGHPPHRHPRHRHHMGHPGPPSPP